MTADDDPLVKERTEVPSRGFRLMRNAQKIHSTSAVRAISAIDVAEESLLIGFKNMVQVCALHDIH